MLVLAIDTSGRCGGITLARGSAEQCDIVESTAIQGGTFSAELIPQISEILGRHSFAPQQLEGLIAVTGPGSFTGLRIGLTAVKGLAEVLRLRIATVTSLELLISDFGTGDRVLGVLDAGRGDVYARVDGIESLITMDQAASLAQARGLQVVTTDANLAAELPNAKTLAFVNSEVAARIGIKKLLADDIVNVLTLDANYVRKSEAEYMQKLKK